MERPKYRKSTGAVDFTGIDHDRFRVPLVLSVGVEDYDGDLVHPKGFRTSASLYANLEHNPDTNHYGKLVDLTFKSVTIGGKTVDALAGWSQLDKNNPEARQLFDLVTLGVLSGASVEFEQHPSYPPKSRGFKSIRLGRNALEFSHAVLLGAAHCEQPVNRYCGVVLPDPVEVREKAIKYLSDHRDISPVFKKSLSKYTRPVSAVVPGSPVTKKSSHMEDDDYAPPDDPTMADAPADDASTPSDLPPEASNSHDGAQALIDLASRFRELAKKTLHDKSRSQFPKFADQLEKMASQLTSHGEAVESMIGGDDDTEGDESDEDEAPEFEPDDDAEEVAKAFVSTRVRKGVIVTKSGYTPKRLVQFTASQLKPAKKGVAKPAPKADDGWDEVRHRLKKMESRIKPK